MLVFDHIGNLEQRPLRRACRAPCAHSSSRSRVRMVSIQRVHSSSLSRTCPGNCRVAHRWGSMDPCRSEGPSGLRCVQILRHLVGVLNLPPCVSWLPSNGRIPVHKLQAVLPLEDKIWTRHQAPHGTPYHITSDRPCWHIILTSNSHY